MIEVSSYVEDSDGEFDFGKQLIARCVAKDGWPGAKLSWYLDDKPLLDGLGAAFSETVNRRTTVQQFYRKAVAVEDNRKRLVCRAEHERYPNGFMETALPIKLRKSELAACWFPKVKKSFGTNLFILQQTKELTKSSRRI